MTLPGKRSFSILIPLFLLTCAFKDHQFLSNRSAIRNDTLPQSQVSTLKRADIYLVLMEGSKVKIKLQNHDSIMMTKTNFDALPATVKKEISAHNDGKFSEEQIESSYPGGPERWLAFLDRTFKYPEDAIKNKIQGTVVVQFIVDEEGKISDIEAISGPTEGGLREETIRVLQKSGRWRPAIWNGYKVKSYKRQPLTFKLTR